MKPFLQTTLILVVTASCNKNRLGDPAFTREMVACGVVVLVMFAILGIVEAGLAVREFTASEEALRAVRND